MLTVSVEAWIGNAAAVVSGTWGAVSRRARQSGYSRTTLYHHAHRVVQAVFNEQAGRVSYDSLWEDNERLRAENEALWQAWCEAEALREAKQREFASASCAMGLSLTQIVTLLAIVVPAGAVPSRATVGRWVQQACEQAHRLLAVLDRACQGWILRLCLDEIFFHREPILMAVEPASMAWVAGQRGPDRTGDSWVKVITRWPHLEYVLADGGKGLERGVKVANDTRQAQGQDSALPSLSPITMSLDVFHTQRELERVLHRQWKQAERQLEAASEADAKVEQVKQRGRDARGVAAQSWRAWRKAERLFDEAVQADSAVEQITAALAWWGPEGTLWTRARAQEQLRQASEHLHGPQWDKVRRVLSDKRTLRHLDHLHEQLSAAVSEPLLREALTRVWSLSEAMRQAEGDTRLRLLPVVVMQQMVCRRLCAQWELAYERVTAILKGAVRASSAVECVNSVMRMHQGRHRYVSQGMLDLKRVYWNCRTFHEGKRKGHCPYALLGLTLPTYDWWQLLQISPEELEQQLSTQNVRA
jgi:hypothetical protein